MTTGATLKSVVIPGGILLLAAAALTYSGWLTLALPSLTFLYYCALIGGMLLSWKFHSSRIFFALIVLFLATQGTEIFSAHIASVKVFPISLEAVAVLAPVDLILIAMMQERGFTATSMSPIALLLFVQTIVVAVLSQTAQPVPVHTHSRLAAPALPDYVLLIFAAAATILLVRSLLTRKPVDSALLWSLSAFFLALRFTGTPRISTLYSACAACILSASIVESSYILAYHDELTMLPSRRAFNDALKRLRHPYVIAVVDIDHFKRFNDTHGHDTGDQVLQLVAINLSRVTGGGEAFRCGGEEFMILFPGKTTAEVLDHLQQLRVKIEASEFRLRSGDRRQAPRGPDRRNQVPRNQDRRNQRTRRTSKGYAIRQLAQDKPAAPLTVTVSIGAADSTNDETPPEFVLEAADKALYRAKANGRNRLELAAAPGRRKMKAAGIA